MSKKKIRINITVSEEEIEYLRKILEPVSWGNADHSYFFRRFRRILTRASAKHFGPYKYDQN